MCPWLVVEIEHHCMKKLSGYDDVALLWSTNKRVFLLNSSKVY